MTIILAANKIFPTPFGHLQLVRDGFEYEVQPTASTNWNVEPLQIHTVSGGSAIGDPETYSANSINLGGLSEDGAWSIFGQARNLLAGGPPIYYNFDNNSNSYINTLMSLIGLKAADYATYPTSVSSFPGINSDVAQKDWG